MKSSSSLILVFIVTTLMGGAFGRDYLFGVVTSADSLIVRVPIRRMFSLGREITEDYTYTQTATGTTAYTIKAIKIIDNKKIKGSTAEITAGGLEAQTVTLRLTSRRSGSINSVIEIYGRTG